MPGREVNFHFLTSLTQFSYRCTG